MPSEQIISLILTTWNSQNKRLDQMLASYSEAQWYAEIAPARNRGIYLLGHLTAVNDALLPLLGLEERMYPELEAPFLKNPDSATAEYPSISDLKSKWEAVNEALNRHFATLSVEEWLSRHTAVSEEDFEREPHRNKLNVILGRTAHQSYHLGQLALLK